MSMYYENLLVIVVVTRASP